MFEEVFQYAVAQLQPLFSKLPAILRFQLGEKYGLREWASSAYESLLDRTTLLSLDEAKVLGLDKVVQYTNARESIYIERLEEKERDLRKAKEDYRPPSLKKSKKYESKLDAFIATVPTQSPFSIFQAIDSISIAYDRSRTVAGIQDQRACREVLLLVTYLGQTTSRPVKP